MNLFALGTYCMLLLLPACAAADDRSTCDAAAGTFRSGVVLAAPVFQHGQVRQGIELSHTHVRLRADQDGQTYDVAIDNVYAADYVAHQSTIPPTLAAIQVNDRLALCGQLYTSGLGIHWVHTNCGATPTPAHPDGWVKHLTSDGRSGPNLEANPKFCGLFGRRR